MIANDLVLSAVLNPSGSWNAHGPGVTSTAGGRPRPGRDHDRGGISRIAHQRFEEGGLADVPPDRWAGRPGPGAAARGRLRGAWGSRARRPGGWLSSGAGTPMPAKRPGTCIIALMRLSARADYALRAAIELAAASSGHVTADQLARAQQIPGKFLETILTQLRRAGLIRSQRGPDGGFWLARPAAEISLADIIRAIDGQLLGVRGERPENVTYPGVAEPLQQVWIALRANERAVLEQVTLADIVSGNLPDMVRNLTENPSAWV